MPARARTLAAPSEDAIAAAELAISRAEEERSAARAAADDLGFGDKAPEPGRFAPRVRPVYVVEPGRRLDAEGETFVVRDGRTVLLELPHRRVDLITLARDTEVSAAALDLAAAGSVEVARVNGHGETVGRWAGPSQGKARRQLSQAKHCLDSGLATALAKRFVEARVHNQRALLRRLNRDRGDADIAAAASRIAQVYRKLRAADPSLGTLRGIEGEAGSLFWPAVWTAVGTDWAWSRRRQRRPAADPINVVLNALCALLERDIRIAVTREGLHPGFGTLHAGQNDGEALVYDLMEAFRSPVVEALALALIGRRALRPDWFGKRADGSIAMDRQAWTAIIRGYEAWLNRDVRNPQTGENVLWRGLFADQAAALAAHVEGRGEFHAYRMDY